MLKVGRESALELAYLCNKSQARRLIDAEAQTSPIVIHFNPTVWGLVNVEAQTALDEACDPRGYEVIGGHCALRNLQ